jgi:hypothetical protein
MHNNYGRDFKMQIMVRKGDKKVLKIHRKGAKKVLLKSLY